MAWRIREQHMDLRTGYHNIWLEHPDTGAEHIIKIGFKNACGTCGHVHSAVHDELDVQAVIANEIKALEDVHRRMRIHASKHNIPIKQHKRN